MLVHHKASTGHSNSTVNRFHLGDDSGQQVNSGGQDRPVQNHVLHFALGLDAIEGGIVVNHLFHALKPGLKAGVCRPIIANCAPTWLPSTKNPSTWWKPFAARQELLREVAGAGFGFSFFGFLISFF